MHYPIIKNPTIKNLNKIGFSVMAAAALLEILKRQRDAYGLSIYSDKNEYYAPAKGSERHRRMLLENLQKTLSERSQTKTKTYTALHEIADKIHRRSLIFVFTDMFQADKDEDKLFEALRHLKYNKHEVVLFHTFDGKHELNFDFDNTPKRFIDIETGDHINLYADSIKDNYKAAIEGYFDRLKMKCMQYKIDYVGVDINEGFDQILTTYLISRKRFL